MQPCSQCIHTSRLRYQRVSPHVRSLPRVRLTVVAPLHEMTARGCTLYKHTTHIGIDQANIEGVRSSELHSYIWLGSVTIGLSLVSQSPPAGADLTSSRSPSCAMAAQAGDRRALRLVAASDCSSFTLDVRDGCGGSLTTLRVEDHTQNKKPKGAMHHVSWCRCRPIRRVKWGGGAHVVATCGSTVTKATSRLAWSRTRGGD